jgi:hypothetical protein
MAVIPENFSVYPINLSRTAYYIDMDGKNGRILFYDGDKCQAIMCPNVASIGYGLIPPLYHMIFTKDTNYIENRFIRNFVEQYISDIMFRLKGFEWPPSDLDEFGYVRDPSPGRRRTPNHHRTGLIGDDYPIDPYKRGEMTDDPYNRYWTEESMTLSARKPNPGHRYRRGS